MPLIAVRKSETELSCVDGALGLGKKTDQISDGRVK